MHAQTITSHGLKRDPTIPDPTQPHPAPHTPRTQIWDLRNAFAPVLELAGHQKGILSANWCPHDEKLLVSSGKDNRTLCARCAGARTRHSAAPRPTSPHIGAAGGQAAAGAAAPEGVSLG